MRIRIIFIIRHSSLIRHSDFVIRHFNSREGRNRTCHGRCYAPATGFEDQPEHQFHPLCIPNP